MTFGAVFPRVLRPVFGPGLAAVAAAANWWETGGATSAVAVYQPKGAASLAASYINLANPGTYDAAPGSAPTWDTTNGWIFNGSSQYLLASYSFTATTTLLVRAALAPTAGSFRPLVYSVSAPSYFGIRSANANAVQFVYGNTPKVTTASNLSAGVYGMTSADGYLNGTLDKSWSDTLGIISSGFSVGATSAGAAFLACTVQAIAIYDTTLTAPQVAAVSAAMAAL